MSNFYTYLYRLRGDGETYSAQYVSDIQARDNLLGIYGDDIRVIQRESKVIYLVPSNQMSEVQKRGRRTHSYQTS